MSFSYDPHQPTARDRVRGYIQDTDGGDPLETDESIEHMVALLGEWGAKAHYCQQIASRFARPQSIDPLGGTGGPVTDGASPSAPGEQRMSSIALARFWSDQADKARAQQDALDAAAAGGLQSMRPVRSDIGPVHGEYRREPGDFRWDGR